MKSESLGSYVDQSSGKQYEVVKLIRQIRRPDGTYVDGGHEYKTACGYDLDRQDNTESTFELIQIDGILKKII